MAEYPHSGHRQRVKERYLTGGIEVFSKHELVEMLLFFGIPQKDTNPLAHRLIDTFGSIRELLSADRDALMHVEGMTANAATLLNLIGDLRRYCAEEEMPMGTSLADIEDQVKFLMPKFDMQASEALWMVSLDHACRVLAVHLVSRGTPVSSDVNVREILRHALSDNAVKVIIAHNHPSGLALPSRADLDATANIARTLKPTGVKLLDHFIFARGGDCVSFEQTASIRDTLNGKNVSFF